MACRRKKISKKSIKIKVARKIDKVQTKIHKNMIPNNNAQHGSWLKLHVRLVEEINA